MNFLILLALGNIATSTPRPSHESFFTVLCRFLVLDEKTYPAIAQSRAILDWRGHKLLSFDLNTNQRTELWTTDGLHSPAVVAEKGVVVLRTSDAAKGVQSQSDDGIWLFSFKKEDLPRKIAAGNFVEIVGAADQPQRVLVIGAPQPNGDGSVTWPLMQIQFGDTENETETSELMRLTKEDMGAVRGGQILDRKFITEWISKDGGPTNKLKMAKLPIENSTTYQSINLPTEKVVFQPIWANTHTVVCIER